MRNVALATNGNDNTSWSFKMTKNKLKQNINIWKCQKHAQSKTAQLK